MKDLRIRRTAARKALPFALRCCMWAALIAAGGCATYTISGTVASYIYPVSIFNNGSLVATVTGTSPTGNNPFSFSTNNSSYSLTATPPSGETCPSMPNWQGSASNGFGNVSVSGLQISCYPMFISGTVTGLNPNGGWPIYITNPNDFTGTSGAVMRSNGVFRFPTHTSQNYIVLPNTSSYLPSDDNNCQVVNQFPTMTGTATTVANVKIYCNTTPAAPTSRFSPLLNQPPAGVGLMLLMADGTVIANQTGTTSWFRLSPDSSGHYVAGTWTTIASSLCPHGQFASQVLHDGRVFVAGGELGYPDGMVPASTPTCPVVAPQAATSTTPAVLAQNGTGVETEIYDPVADSWSAATPSTSLIDPNAAPANYGPAAGYGDICPAQSFQDMTSELLDDGRVLMAPVCPKNCGDTLLFDPQRYDAATAGSGWSFAGKLANTAGTEFSCSEQETSWVKLQDGTVLTADPPATPGALETSERFEPGLSQWVNDAGLGFTLFNNFFGWDSDGEEGPAFLLPGGQALFIGGSSVYGIYTPGTNGGSGSWAQFPLTPNGPANAGAALAADDKPGVMMASGSALLALNYAAGTDDAFPGPVLFYEFQPAATGAAAGAFTEVAGPPRADVDPWADCSYAPNPYFNPMLQLPDGTVLTTGGCNASQLYVYQPLGSPSTTGQPTINSGPNSGAAPGWAIEQLAPQFNTFFLTGTGLTGISEGASFGDDAQMASNYPLVRLTDTTGRVYYARTHQWLSTNGLTPGSPGTTYFDVPLDTPPNTYSLQVVVNGNPSAPASFTWNCPQGYVWISIPFFQSCVM